MTGSRTVVDRAPRRNDILDRWSVDLRGAGAGAAVERDVVVSEPVQVQGRHRRRGRALPEQCAGHRRDRREECGVAGEAVVHDGAVGHAGGVDPARVDADAGGDVLDHRGDERDVVGAAVPGDAAAAAAGVPGPQLPVGVGDREPVRVRLRVPTVRAGGLGGVAEAAMQHDNQRHGSGRSPGRDVEHVVAAQAADGQRLARRPDRYRRRADAGRTGAGRASIGRTGIGRTRDHGRRGGSRRRRGRRRRAEAPVRAPCDRRSPMFSSGTDEVRQRSALAPADLVGEVAQAADAGQVLARDGGPAAVGLDDLRLAEVDGAGAGPR